METSKEFSKPENLIQKKSAIHYVVKGRRLQKDSSNKPNYFEAFFFDENPILAREKAFSFYQNYATILEEHKLLFQKQLSLPFNFSKYNCENSEIQKYSTADVKYQNPTLFDKGIAIYMITEKPISYMDKTDKKLDRHLIHGIWNFKENDMLAMINGLIREYGYYAKHKYETKNQTKAINLKSYRFQGLEDFSILSIPFDWHSNYYLKTNNQTIMQNRRISFYQSCIQKGTLARHAYETKLDNAKLIRIIASLINTSGGSLFYGINESRHSVSVFKKIQPSVFKKEVTLLLRQEFPLFSNLIQLRFLRVGVNIVAMFEVNTNREIPVFVAENKQKRFYIRDENGLVLMKDPEEITAYNLNHSLSPSSIQDILKFI